ncbi:MAG: acyclic terpene utilization AtuA family protein [Rhodospirillaceae bacterium]|nr:acyclic terpene utilization AtuA family protein [Rhodospirillaceae bacterium]
MTSVPDIIRIGGASGYWGESAMATPQLLADRSVDFLVYDYLAEITMSILARARAKDPATGYATDFISAVLKPNIREIAAQRVRVVSNAGGVNPGACAEAARAVIAEAGLDLKVGVVHGDDLMAEKERFAEAAPVEMFSGEPFPPAAKLASINAYIGAFPIAAALDAGADIVITGRCVDSAVTLGACIHAFGWRPGEWDRLAAGSLAGHILECGPQATGGNHTDWEDIAGSIHNIGYPIGDIETDGSFTLRKPAGSGGMVTVGTVAEQMVYEIGDPQAYLLPDVCCDFSRVEMKQAGRDRVRVTGASGRPAPPDYKVSATWADGFRAGGYFTFTGRNAAGKAQVFADAAIARARAALRGRNLGDFTETSVEAIGAGSQYGPAGDGSVAREVVLKLAVRHPESAGVGMLLREASGLGLATPAALSGFSGTRPRPSPVVRLFSFLVPKADVALGVEVDGVPVPYVEPACTEEPGAPARPAPPDDPGADAAPGEPVDVRLEDLAWGRSGDKGDKANIGIIARRAEYLPWIWRALTEKAVAGAFAHFLDDAAPKPVERFLMPGSNAINFLLHDVLGGGGVASLRNDAQGKGYAQILLDTPIPVPKPLAVRAAADAEARAA